jgi:lysozyme family protein
MASRRDFELSFELLIGHEGGWGNHPDDRGNWTTGVCGQGENRGTKYGICAASYPTHDIKNLTLDQARDIYHRDYWTPARCPEMRPRLALIVFDSAVNNGVGRAIGFVQTAVGATSDGAWGPNTQAAFDRASARDIDDTALAAEVHAQRIYFMAQINTWNTFGLGWSRRLALVPLQAGIYWPLGPEPAAAA